MAAEWPRWPVAASWFGVLILGSLALLAPKPEPRPRIPVENSVIDRKTRDRIEEWIRTKGLNSYGDARGTMYAGGTPLFDETTGIRRDRYEYILEKHPELRADENGPVR